MLYLETDFGYPAPNDNGTRPYTGTNTPFWNNASIWLTGGSGVTQTSTHVNDATDARVRVTNSGTAPVDLVSVDVYVLNPFLGVPDPLTPGRSLHTFGGSLTHLAPGSGIDSPTDPHVAQCEPSWMPTQSDLAGSTGGHLCLLANVYGDGDGSALGSGEQFDVANNPHHGQRNITLLASQTPTSGFMLQVMPALDGASTVLDIHALNSRTAIGMGENWLLRSKANVVRVPGPGGRQQYFLTGSRGRPDTALSFSRKAIAGTIELQRDGVADLGAAARATKAAVARAGNADKVAWHPVEGAARIKLAGTREIQTAKLSLQRDDGKGSLQAFDIVQRSEEGTILGGIRILSLVTAAPR
jgi:hypothetical protein